MGEIEAGSTSSLAGAGESQLEIVVLRDDNALIPVSDEVKKWFGSILNGESTENQHEAICSKIEKVPGMLRDVKKNSGCYVPMVVSIGPYHRGKPELKLMQKHKLTMARQYVKGVDPKLLQELYQKVNRLAIDAKKCYTDLSEVAKKDEDTDQSSAAKKNEDTDHGSVADEEFSQMMFLDACFILQFIYRIVKKEEEALKMKSNMIALVQRDLFLLENQIPFQVLNELSFESKFGDENSKQTMLNEFVTLFLGLPAQSPKKVQDERKIAEKFEPAHLLDLMHSNLLGKSDWSQHSTGSDWTSYRSVKELKAVGIHCRPSETNKFTDVAFKTGYLAKLELPRIRIDDSTKSMLQNMVAYESSPNGPNDLGVSSYVCLMNSLIDHAEDVKELRSKGILLNCLGSDQQVADLFNEIADNLVSRQHAYRTTKEEIETHYKNIWKNWLGECVHNHFTSPWTVLVFIGAVLAIFLSVNQTLELFKPSKS
ncbi:hypothetical protein Pint_20095 [Pistacia integerrima]|uniref:Uncharacterized protein n=1 Tax=Pistacia integerrima TaxID=434235 RepID=A0ACC0XCF1_9ROSI|nr:hypothetical protein Pint_20095 [Pistacia integerrima]